MSSDWSIWQDPAVASAFTQSRRGGILGAEVQLQTMVQLVSHVPRRPMRVLDLGTGDGILLEALLQNDPIELAVALDGSSAMLEQARQRLGGYATAGKTSIHFVHADFSTPAWLEKVDANTFDAIVSGFAIHHCEDERKKALYREIFGLLAPGGVFVNIEHVASASPLGEEMFEVLKEHRSRADRAANRLAPVGVQLSWLQEIGFADVDCYWKHFELAVLAGYRPR
jgi:tRNA (cmo5U34)-methyltransferase